MKVFIKILKVLEIALPFLKTIVEERGEERQESRY